MERICDGDKEHSLSRAVENFKEKMRRNGFIEPIVIRNLTAQCALDLRDFLQQRFRDASIEVRQETYTKGIYDQVDCDCRSHKMVIIDILGR